MLPHALTIGIDYRLFWHLTPKKISAFEKAYNMKRELEDEKMWQLGMYIQSAVSVAIDHSMNGKKAKSKYLEKPLMKIAKDENIDLLTEDEKLEKVKTLFAMLEARKEEFDRQKN